MEPWPSVRLWEVAISGGLTVLSCFPLPCGTDTLLNFFLEHTLKQNCVTRQYLQYSPYDTILTIHLYSTYGKKYTVTI